MTHDNGFLICHAKNGHFDFMIDGTLTEVEWAKIMLQIMQQLKASGKDKPKDQPLRAGTFIPDKFDEMLKKKMR